MTPKYTFLLPAYKAEFFKQALESIQAQTYKDFLVIISDDCSPEDLYAIAKPFLDDSRFSYRRNEKNMGAEDLAKHWNLLLSLADTEFITIATDDDVYEPTFLETLDRLTEKYPEVNVFHSPTQDIDAEGKILKMDYCYKEYMSGLEFWYYFMHAYHTGIPQFIFRRQELADRGGFVEFPFAWGSDGATVLMMAGKGLVSSQETLCSFRWSEINISSQTDGQSLLRKIGAQLEYGKWLDARVKEIVLPDDKYKGCYQRNVVDFMHIYNKQGLFFWLKSCHGATYLKALKLIKYSKLFSMKDQLSIIRHTIL